MINQDHKFKIGFGLIMFGFAIYGEFIATPAHRSKQTGATIGKVISVAGIGKHSNSMLGYTIEGEYGEIVEKRSGRVIGDCFF